MNFKVFSMSVRCLSSAGAVPHYRLLVAGGGSGGSAIANKFVSKLADQVAVIEPADMHYYQPMWTLVGAGIKTLEQSGTPMADVLPKKATWIKKSVASIDPDANSVTLQDGSKVTYDFLVVAMGISLNFEAIRGMPEAWSDPRVCSNYSPQTVNKTFTAFKNFTGGEAVFTFPNTPIKCPGAPQKIAYLFDDYLRRNNRRDTASISYNTSLPVIFGIKKYAAALMKVCEARDIKLRTRHNLVEIRPDSSEAVFVNLDTEEEMVLKYSLLHVAPPMRPHAMLKEDSPALVDANGFVSVDKDTLQHTKYKNVFAIGDCTNAPTSKTAAAVATQAGVISKNLSSVMAGGDPRQRVYDGYTSCPLVTGYKSCILAEFDYNGQPLETLPIDQGKERYLSFVMKTYIMPTLYWKGLVKGLWNGPKWVRKAFHLGMGK